MATDFEDPSDYVMKRMPTSLVAMTTWGYFYDECVRKYPDRNNSMGSRYFYDNCAVAHIMALGDPALDESIPKQYFDYLN